MPDVRFAIIGAGMGAETHAAELPHVRGARLVAIYARNAGRASRFAQKFGVAKVYHDIAALLADPNIDAVIIVLPNGLHRDVAVAAARAGKHVVVEKPLDITSARAIDIIAACRDAGVSLSLIYQMRFCRVTGLIKRALDSGAFGKPLLVNVLDNEHRSPAYYANDDWRGTREFEGGGCLMTQSTHLIDLIQYLMGPIVSVSARVKTAWHAIETEDTAVATLEFASGVLGVLSSSTAVMPAQRHLVSVFGSGGLAVMNGEYDHLYSWHAQSGETPSLDQPFDFGDISDPRLFPTERHRTQLQSITDQIAAGGPPVTDGADLLRALRVTEAIYRSSQLRREVSLAEIEAAHSLPPPG